MIVDVLVPYRVHGSFHYLMDDDISERLRPGSLVKVPFKNRSTHGFVIGIQKTSEVREDKLKRVEEVIQYDPLFNDITFSFLKWVSDYYCHPLGEVIETAIPKISWNRTTKQKERTDESKSHEWIQVPPPFKLTEEQAIAVEKILSTNNEKPFLLHGVTGSGKTEIYLRVLETVLHQKRSAIILVPEIALTPQLLSKFSVRFPGLTAGWHSSLTKKERREVWKRVVEDQSIVIGARSALFLPVKELGLIIVDEEHEGSYKQEEGLRYHARDMAIVRASLEKVKIVLGSATPSLESLSNAQRGKYHYLSLSKRVENQVLPQVTFVDMKDESEKTDIPWLSKSLKTKIQKILQEKNQALLFLNRLGYAHFLYCDDCGYTYRCSSCDVSLTYYQKPPRLLCHYCGVQKKPPSVCDQCSGREVKTIGFGTEQVEKGLKELFPTARVGRMDRSVVKTKKDLESLLDQMNNREIDLIVGTQMMAKGHDFPNIVLVGVLLADASLNIPDFRSSEKTFQIITQVAGRAGRSELRGEVILQTFSPTHPVLVAASQYGWKNFYESELSLRERYQFPPYAKLAAIRFQHRNPRVLEKYVHELSEKVRNKIRLENLNCILMGPSQAPLSKIKKFHRWHFVLKGKWVRSIRELVSFIQETHFKTRGSVQMTIDIDPMNLT